MESSINLFVGHSFLFLFFLTAQFGLHFASFGTIDNKYKYYKWL
jgi:hypothetical protein